MLIPRTRYPKFAMYIRHPLLGRVDVTSYVDSWEFKRGDVGGIGTGGSGADSVVSILTFTLRNSGQNLYAWDENAEVDEARQIDESKEIPDSMPAKDFFAYLFGVDPELQIESFSPRANAWWNEGEPLLDDSRKVELWESEEGELKLRCIMLINEVKPDKSRVKVTALDPAQILQRAYILDKKTYGTEEGTPAETVIQQIIVENAPNFVSPDEITSTEHYQLTIKHATETFNIDTNPQTFTLQHEPISLSSVSVTDWSLTSRELSPAEYTLNGNQITINIPEDPLTMLGATFVYTYRLPLFTGGDSRTFEFSHPIISAEGTLLGDVNRPLTPSEIVIDGSKITITVDPSDTNGYESLDLTYTYQPDFFYCPVPSQFMITPYEVQYKTVWEAIQDIATQRGWYLGFKMVNGEWKLSFLEPPRSKTTPDWTLTADDDIYTQDLTISAKDVRNLIKITYRDKSTGKRESVIVEDKASQARYGLMAMEIEESDTSNIDTEEEALRMANSALHDLSSQTSNTNINMPLFMDIDLFDIIAVENQFLSSTVDLFAVDSVSHSWSKGKMRTDLICSGKVVGGKKRWLMKETRAGRSEPIRRGDIAPEQIDTDRLGTGATTTEKIAERAISDFATFSITDDRADITTATDFVEIPNYSLNFTIANTAQVLLSGNALVWAYFTPEPDGTSIDLGTILRWRLYRNGTLLDNIWHSNLAIHMFYDPTESSPFSSIGRSDNASFNRIMDLDSGNYEIKAEIKLARRGSQDDFALVGIRSLNAVILKR